MKLCPHCNQEKPFEAFYRSLTHKSGYASWCIVCEKKRNRAKNTLNTVSRNAKAKEWRESNKATYLAGISATNANLSLATMQGGVSYFV